MTSKSPKIIWKGEIIFDSDFKGNKFRVSNQKKIYQIDKNGFWFLNATLCWGMPWIKNGTLHGAPVDLKLKEEIEKLNSPSAESQRMNFLNSVWGNPNVSMFMFPKPAFIERETKVCSHITWANRFSGEVCSECCTYKVIAPMNGEAFMANNK